MKPSDFMPSANYDERDIKPSMQADMDRLQAMFDSFHHNCLLMSKLTQVYPIDNTKTTKLGNLTIVEIGDPGFHGINICMNCTKLAITAFRDAAGALEDIVKFVENYTPPTPKG
jgi:hypothetical protein